MNYRRLGRTGLKVSEVSFGSWITFGNQVDTTSAGACMRAAYEGGVNFFDNAEGYAGGKSEEVMGELLAGFAWPRDSFIVSSKVFFGARRDWPTQTGLSFKHVRDACDDALKRLRVDYLDLYFCHRPDPETPIDETVRAMNQLITAGKVLYWGTSEWSAAEIATAHAMAAREGLVGPSMEQSLYNIFSRRRIEQEYATLFRDFGMGTTIFSPLAQGLLTGKYNEEMPTDSRAGADDQSVSFFIRRGWDEAEGRSRLEACRGFAEIAADAGMSMAHLAIAWCLSNPNISTAIMGATRPEQVVENVAASESSAKLTPEIKARIDEVCRSCGADVGVSLEMLA
ncbi:MAG: aldo/keto reductase [Planctomycetota bacterium]